MRFATGCVAVTVRAVLAMSAAVAVFAVLAPAAAWGQETVWLGSLDLSKMEQGWGKPQIDRSITEKPLTLGGRRFAHGVGTHARSIVWIDLGGGSDRFLATVGIDDAAGGSNPVTFRIAGDGKTLFDSGIMKLGQPPKAVDINLKGVKTLVLMVGPVGSIDFTHGDWADARFLVSGAKPRTMDAREKAVILTPPPPRTPRINGARIFGVRPGSLFFFTIPATGQRPMTFAVEGLPADLSVDPKTGRITGTLNQRGEYAVAFQATNALGTAHRGFKIVCGDTLALTPEMGWNSWYYWTDRVTDKVMRDGADAMVLNGMINHGYIYANIDDCWANRPGSKDPNFNGPPGDAAGKVNSTPRFPDMKAMTDYIHHRGLRAGIYTSPGPTTCAAARGRSSTRSRTPSGLPNGASISSSTTGARARRRRRDWPDNKALPQNVGVPQEATPRHRAEPLPIWHGQQLAVGQGSGRRQLADGRRPRPRVLHRTVRPDGPRGLRPLRPDQLHKYAGPGGWNDPDYLQLGYLSQGWTKLSPSAQYTQVPLWSLVAAPLILGGDVTRLDAFTLNLLCNDEVIDVDQDPLGKPGHRVAKDGDQEVWARQLEDGSLAVGLFNRNETEAKVTAKWSDLGLHGKQRVRDLWRQKDLGVLEGQFSSLLPPQARCCFVFGRRRSDPSPVCSYRQRNRG